MKDDRAGIWARFEMPGCTGVRYARTRPILHAGRGMESWPAPDMICQFIFGGGGALPVYGVFLDWGHSPSVFAPAGIGEEMDAVAEAIGAVQHLQYFPPNDAYGAFQVVGGLMPHVIAAYQVAPEMRKNYPWMHNVLTKNTPNGGHIYLLHDQQGHYKIGRSGNVDNRVKQLRTQPPFNIEIVAHAWVPDCKAEEKRLHDLYKEFRLRGEWFDLSENDVNQLRSEIEWYAETGGQCINRYQTHPFEDWREILATCRPWFLTEEEDAKQKAELYAMTASPRKEPEAVV